MKTQNNTKRLLMTLAALVLLPAVTASAATITTNQEDYAPWEIVTLTGGGFAANATVDMLITWPDGYPDLITGVLADASGGFTYYYDKEKFGGTYTVEAVDDANNTATTTFTDAANIKIMLGGFPYASYTNRKVFPDVPVGTSLTFEVAISAGGLGSDKYLDWSLNYTTGSANDPRDNATLSVKTTEPTVLPATGHNESSSDSSPVDFEIGTTGLTAGTTFVGHLRGTRTGGVNLDPGEFYFEFKVVIAAPSVPTVTDVSPSSGNRGDTLTGVIVTGTNFTGATAVDFGTGITVDSFTVDSATQITASITISASANLGSRDVSVYKSLTVFGTKTNGFTVTDGAAPTGSVLINGGATWTKSLTVTVNLSATDDTGVTGYKLANGTVTDWSLVAPTSVTSTTSFALDVTGWDLDGTTNTVSVRYRDEAGNWSAVYTASISFDNEPPTTTISLNPSANANGWNKTNVEVTLSATDNAGGSGVAFTYYSLSGAVTQGQTTYTVPFTISTEGTTTVTFWSVDNAANEETAQTQDINIDKTPPTITASRDTAANSNGWNNSDVTVSYSASDTLSGMDSPATGTHVITTEGADQSYTFTVYDKAGNSASDTVTGINIDKTKPVITITCPTAGASYTLNEKQYANWSSTDALSGIDSDTAKLNGVAIGQGDLLTGSVGAKTFVVTAVDKAGNTATNTVEFSVQFNFLGFLPPVDNPTAVNMGKAGRTYPIKWQLTDADGKYIGDLSVVTSLRWVCTGDGTTSGDVLTEETSGASGLRYDPIANQYIFTWQTQKIFANRAYTLTLTLSDGTTHQALFSFTK